MLWFLWLILGICLGACAGAVIVSLIQANKNRNNDDTHRLNLLERDDLRIASLNATWGVLTIQPLKMVSSNKPTLREAIDDYASQKASNADNNLRPGN